MSNYVIKTGSGGSGGAAVPVVVSGSPFADFTALDTWSQANPSELLNNEFFYAVASLVDESSYRWDGVDQVYSSNGWTSTSALTPEEKTILDSITALTDGQLVYKLNGQLIYAGATKSSVNGEITFDQKANFPQGSVGIGEILEISEGGTDLVVVDLLQNTMSFSVNAAFEDSTGSAPPTYVDFGAPFTLNIQTDDTTVITANPLNYTLTSTVVTPDFRLLDRITIRGNGAMTNVRARFTDNVTGKVLKYIPNRAAFEGNVAGLDLIAGDNVFFFAQNGTNVAGTYYLGFTPIILSPSQIIDVEFIGDNIDLLGNATGTPYQIAEAHDGPRVEVGGGGDGDVIGPASSIDTELALFSGTTGKVIEGGSKITADTSLTDSLLVMGTTSAAGTGFPSIDFVDVNSVFLASVRYDEADFELDLVSQAGINLSASSDMYFTSNGVFEIRNLGGDLDLLAQGNDIIADSNNFLFTLPSLSINATTNGFTFTPSSSAPYGFGFNGDSSISQNPTTNQFQISSAAGDMICQVLNGFSMNFISAQDSTFQATLGDFNLTAGNDVIINGGTSVQVGFGTFTGDVLQFVPSSPVNTYGLVFGSTVDGQLFMNGSTKELSLTSNTGDVNLTSVSDDVTINALNGEVLLSAESGNSAITLGANSTIASDVQLNIVGGAECSFGAGLSLNMSSTEGIYLGTGVPNQFPVTFVNGGTGGGRCDQYVIDFDPDGVLTALNGAVAYRVDETTPANIKEYRLKATGSGSFNTPWVEIGGGGDGDVEGPTSSIDTELAIFNGVSGNVIQGGTNITAEVGQSNAELNISTTNDTIYPEIFFNGVTPTSVGEGWIYLEPDNSVFGVRGANAMSLSGGTKLDVSCDAGDLDITTLTSDINLTSNGGVSITANGASGISLSAPTDNVGMFVANDIVMFSNNDDTLQLQTLGQLGTNGGQYSVHVGNRDPQNQFGSGQGAMYMRQGSNPSESDIYITDAGGVNNWVALKGGPALLEWGDGNIQTTTTDRFLTPNYDSGVAPTAPIQKTMTRRGFLEQMRVKCRVANGNGNPVVYTLQINGLDTPLAVTLNSNQQSGANTTSRVQVSAGDFITLKASKAAGIGTSPQDIIVDINYL